MKKILFISTLILGLSLSSCRDMLSDVKKGDWNHERNIVDIKLENQVGSPKITRTDSDALIELKYNLDATGSLQIPIEYVIPSYGAMINVKAGDVLSFDNATNTANITVTGVDGKTLEWTIKIEIFTEEIKGKWILKSQYLYGGTGPSYGGGNFEDLFNPSVQSLWGTSPTPINEADNIYEFVVEGFTASGNTYGRIINDAGADGQYGNYLYRESGKPETDCDKFYRNIPVLDGTWEHDYAQNLIIIKSADGKVLTAKFNPKGYSYTGWGDGKMHTFAGRTLEFDLRAISSDNWDAIYSYYDKVACRPYFTWIEMELAN